MSLYFNVAAQSLLSLKLTSKLQNVEMYKITQVATASGSHTKKVQQP